MENSKKHWRTTLLRVGLIVLSAVMLLCGTYFATVAFLSLHTGETPLKNTFVHASLLDDPEEDFILTEKKAGTDTNDNGIVDDTLSDVTMQGATYLYVPGVTLQKHPYVKITNLRQNAYLFVEFTGNVPAVTKATTGLQWMLDLDDNGKDCWRFVENTGSRQIYLYIGSQSNGDNMLTPKDGTYTIDIMQDHSVIVPETIYTVDGGTKNVTEAEISFSAYLVQATGFASADAAWNATYGK